MLVTTLNPHVAHEQAARISRTAYAEDITVRDAALKLGFVTAEEFDSLVAPGRETPSTRRSPVNPYSKEGTGRSHESN